VLVGKLVGGMHFGVTIGAQRSFVGTTNDRGLRTLTHIALDLHRARNTALLHRNRKTAQLLFQGKKFPLKNRSQQHDQAPIEGQGKRLLESWLALQSFGLQSTQE
jgi:hypothetical protein